MLIKNMWLWHSNSEVWNEDFVMFGIVVISIICAFITAVGTYWGLSIFGPWYQGSQKVWYFTCGSFVVQQFYFWSRYARYSMLHRQRRLNRNTGEIVSNNLIKKWFNKRKYAKENMLNAKNREREIALGFAGEIRK